MCTYSNFKADTVVDVAECSKRESDEFGHYQHDLERIEFTGSRECHEDDDKIIIRGSYSVQYVK